MSDLILAIDQGTSATKAALVDGGGKILGQVSVAVSLQTPAPGHVEQSATEIWASVRKAVSQCMDGQDGSRVAAVGLSTQRESLVLWDRATGEPCGPVLSWQDRRTAEECARLAEHAELVLARSGLPLDPMFSALKARWLLNTYRRDGVRLGTVDSFLLSRMSGATHTIEVGNAARTQLLDVATGDWSAELLELFGVPPDVLPDVVASTGPFPAVRGLPPLRDGTPIGAIMGDSHAAFYAQGGRAKATYGTGSSVMALAESEVKPGALGLTIAWDAGAGPVRALEGNIRATGATLTWLASLLETTPGELAEQAADSAEGLMLVPAFGGLAAPWWDESASGLICGLTLSTGRPQLARAALESIAYQIEDVVDELERQAAPLARLHADGGASENPTLMQLQADIGGRTVAAAKTSGLSALGVALLAGGGELSTEIDYEIYEPLAPQSSRLTRRAAWHEAVARARRRAERTHV